MHFERVKFEAFKHDMMQWRPMNFLEGVVETAYENIQLPERKTQFSCGYDVRTPISVVIAPHTSIVIPTGIKAVFTEDEMMTWSLKLYARSSVGIKDKVVITNGTGLIDSDFQDSENDGDMLIALTNMSDEVRKYNAGDRVCQAVFEIFGITSDDKASGKRTGGVGSTNVNTEERIVIGDDCGIEHLDLSVRTYNALRRGGINTIKELRAWFYAGSHRKPIRDVGERTLIEIIHKLRER